MLINLVRAVRRQQSGGAQEGGRSREQSEVSHIGQSPQATGISFTEAIRIGLCQDPCAGSALSLRPSGFLPRAPHASGRRSNATPALAGSNCSPAQSGWSPKWLAAAEEWSRAIGSSAVVVVQHGAIVASWGDTNADLLLNSARKSLLSALIGIAVAKHQIDLNATMGELGIDDNPPALTQSEKQATVLDLLEAQSGVYHAANYETPLMAAKRPPRGSHPPGTFWYYNNWDFNALGSIYQHAAGESVFSAFAQQIATPLQMQDFDPEVQVCRRGRFRNTPPMSSMHPHGIWLGSACFIYVTGFGRADRSFRRHGSTEAPKLTHRPMTGSDMVSCGGS